MSSVEAPTTCTVGDVETKQENMGEETQSPSVVETRKDSTSQEPGAPMEAGASPEQPQACCRVFVGNLPYHVSWSMLKEKMRELGITPAKVDIDNAAQDEDERGSRLDAATLYTFSGAMAFHDSDGNVHYELTVTNGQVSGNQYWRDDKEPVAKIVGGWFDFERRRLSVLIQGADHTQAQWRSQIKQFHLVIGKRQVVCDYDLYDYGRHNESLSTAAPHILDKLDRIEHLVK